MKPADEAAREVLHEFEANTYTEIEPAALDRLRELFRLSVMEQLASQKLAWNGVYREFVLRCAAQTGARCGWSAGHGGTVSPATVDAAIRHFLSKWIDDCPDRRGPDGERNEGPPCFALIELTKTPLGDAVTPDVSADASVVEQS